MELGLGFGFGRGVGLGLGLALGVGLGLGFRSVFSSAWLRAVATRLTYHVLSTKY